MTCQKCGSYFPSSTVIDGKRKSMGSRRFCLTCSPFGSSRAPASGRPRNSREITGSCYICGKPKRGRAKRCTTCDSKIRRIAAKQAAIALLGGKCFQCGWAGAPESLEFHHPGFGKEFTISLGSNLAWERIVSELSRCVLLCSNCHRSEHHAPPLRQVAEIAERLAAKLIRDAKIQLFGTGS